MAEDTCQKRTRTRHEQPQMNHSAIQELVDNYLLNQISPGDKKRLLTMMDHDPELARYVKEGVETVQILQLARDRDLRDKLKRWDARIEKTQRGKGKRLLFLFVLGLLAIVFWCWMTYRFSPENLAMQSFKAIPANVFPYTEREPFLDAWQRGNSAFLRGDYEKALIFYLSCTGFDAPAMSDQVRWNILLCQLAINGPSNLWLQDLSDFSLAARDPFQSEAENLLRRIQSPLYSILYHGVLHKTITSIKPKII